MNFLIVYERKNRELENAVLLKVELEQRGHNCCISQYYQAKKFNILNRKKYDVIVVPSLYSTESVRRTIARFGIPNHIVNLQYEQVLSDKWEKLGHHNPSGDAINHHHVCWGPNTTKRLLSAGVPCDNVHTLGAMQLDLLREEYLSPGRARTNLAEEFNIPITCYWTLFLSSFTYADIDQSRLAMNEKVAKTDLSDFVDIHTKSRNELLIWFERVLSKDQKRIFIYRPHPDELSLDKVKNLEDKYRNFFVLGIGSAKVWIESCDKILSWYSTTVVESHFLRKPYMILRPYLLPEYFDSVLLKKGKFTTTQVEFEEAYFVKEKYSIYALEDKDIEKYYTIDTEEPTFKKIVTLLINLGDEPSFVSNYGWAELFSSKVKSLLVSVFCFAASSISHHKSLLYFFNKMEFFSKWYREIQNQYTTDAEIRLLERSLITKMKKR